MKKKTLAWVGLVDTPVVIVNTNVIHCKTFGNFVEYFANINSPDQLPDRISLAATDIFENGTLTPVEIIGCYSNSVKLINQRFGAGVRPIDISVRVGQKILSQAQAEILQKNDIVGIVPKQVVYGVEAVLDAFDQLQKYNTSWPGYLISDQTSGQSDAVVLTPRQQVILELIRNRGLSNKQIARYLNLSESTIKFHVGHILNKYQLRNRTQLAVLAKAK